MSYDIPGDAPLFQALAERCHVIGHTAPLRSRKMLWSSAGSRLDCTSSDNLVRRLLSLREQVKQNRWPKRLRLNEVVAALSVA